MAFRDCLNFDTFLGIAWSEICLELLTAISPAVDVCGLLLLLCIGGSKAGTASEEAGRSTTVPVKAGVLLRLLLSC